MAFCINCGQELAEGAKFCANCGKAVTGENTVSQRKTVYEGNLHKCPNCGEVLNSFVTNCPTCGHEIRDTQGVSSVRQLAMKLEQLEAKRPQKKGTNIFAQTFGGGAQLQSIDEQKIDLIRNFSIPNTKEDVLEFIVLAAANIDLKVYGLYSGRYQMLDPARRELSDAWLSKLEQADQKAEIMFGQTQEYISMRNVYEKKMKAIKRAKYQIVWLLVGLFGVIFLMFGFVLLILAL
ncbi:MAG: zinc ribbon domain-containing protein [Clostridiales bacterium]|nr:zinc ribbon domain-containing protein [Clostridiales bacterium]